MSHRLDALAAELAHQLKTPLASPFSAHEVIVPDAAMRQHLSLVLADAVGICANVRFSWLAHWFWEQIGKILPLAKDPPYAADMLVWRIFHILGDPDFVEAYPRPGNWLKNNDQTGRYEFSCLLARLFEQYLIYRPDWLLAWFEKRTPDLSASIIQDEWPADDEAWQAALWRKIEAQTGSDGIHPAHRFFEMLKSDTQLITRLPDRLHVFCLPSIAPQYLSMLEKISEWVEVDLYVLNPCREYWLDVIPEKRMAQSGQDERDIPHETGRALLAAWGKQSRSHLSLLIELNDDWRFLPDGETQNTTLLGRLQTSVLNLEALTLEELAEDDRSLEVHVCHSLMREIEVLHDQLLALFASKNPPLPADIVIVTPDVDKAAPLVDAVFCNTTADVRIPFRIMGRSGNRINPVAQALTDILALAASRFTAAGVYELLLCPLISQRFALESELDQVHTWLGESGICWGLDGEQKTALGLPTDDSRSFLDGFHRLFLAYALPPETTLPFSARLPTGNPEGTRAAALGILWHFVGKLRALKDEMSAPKDAKSWRNTVMGVLDGFILADTATLEDDLAVRQTLNHLFDCMEAGGSLPVDAEVMRHALTAALEESSRKTLPSGAVTFTSMAGLRNLPYRFVCAIGLSDGVFPAESRPPEFDLMAYAASPGDVQRRNDDRNVFLDLLLCARERLYLSYTGRSVRDNSIRPPSVVVSELLDVIVRALAGDSGKNSMDAAREKVENRLVLHHPLQAFSHRYFDGSADPRIQSARHDFCQAQQRRLTVTLPVSAHSLPAEESEDDEDDAMRLEVRSRFFTHPLPTPDEKWRDVSIQELTQFFLNPARYLLSNRLGMAFPSREEILPSDEPLLPDPLDSYRLAERILPLFLAGEEESRIMETALAGLEYPSGAIGKMLMARMVGEMAQFTNRFSGDTASPPIKPVEGRLSFELEHENWSLSGSLDDVRESGLLYYRYAGMDTSGSIRLRINAWIRHLFLNALAPTGILTQTVCWFKDEKIVFPPCSDKAKSLLLTLVELYRDGLVEPLRFFPASAVAYLDKGEKAAGKKWKPSSHGRKIKGEGEESFNHLATRGLPEPLDEVFATCAKRALGEMMAQTERTSHDGNA